MGHPKRSTGDGPSFGWKLVLGSDLNVLQLLGYRTAQDSRSIMRVGYVNGSAKEREEGVEDFRVLTAL